MKIFKKIINIILTIPVAIVILLGIILLASYYTIRNIITFLLRAVNLTEYKPSSILNSTIYILTKANKAIKNIEDND